MYILKKKMTEITVFCMFCISEITDLNRWLDKCLESSVWEDPSRSNMVNVPKHCSNLHHSNFIILIHHLQGNWIGKSHSYWHGECWDCLLEYCLPMKGILFVMGDNLMIPSQMQLSQKQKTSKFSDAFSKYRLNFVRFANKDDPHSFFFCEIANSENVVR